MLAHDNTVSINMHVGYVMKLRGRKDLDTCRNLYDHLHVKRKLLRFLWFLNLGFHFGTEVVIL